MSVVGQFMREDDGFIGHLDDAVCYTKTSSSSPAEPSDAEKAPDFRVHVLDTNEQRDRRGDRRRLEAHRREGWRVRHRCNSTIRPLSIRSAPTCSSRPTTSPPGACTGTARPSAASGTERCPPRAIALPSEEDHPSDAQPSFSFPA